MTKVNIKPLGDRVLVLPEDKNEKVTASGIIVQTEQKEKPRQGKVLEVGTLSDVTDVKKGDTVMFSEYGYDSVKIDDIEYYIIKSKDLLAVLK